MVNKDKNEIDKQNLPPPAAVCTFRGSGSPVTSVEFYPAAKERLISGNQNGKVKLWNLKTRRCETTLNAHSDKSVLSLKQHDEKLITQARDGYLKIWKCSGSSYELEKSLEISDGFCAALFLPCSRQSMKHVAVPGKDSDIHIYDTHNHSVVQILTPSSGCKLSKDGLGMCMCLDSMQPTFDDTLSAQIVSGYESGHLVVWDLRSAKELSRTAVFDDMMTCIAYSPQLNKGLCGSVNETIVQWRLDDTGTCSSENRRNITNPGLNNMAIRSDSKIAAAACWDFTIRIFSMRTLRPLAVLQHHRDSVQCVSFSTDFYLAAGSKDHNISLWDIYQDA